MSPQGIEFGLRNADQRRRILTHSDSVSNTRILSMQKARSTGPHGPSFSTTKVLRKISRHIEGIAAVAMRKVDRNSVASSRGYNSIMAHKVFAASMRNDMTVGDMKVSHLTYNRT